MGIAAIAVLLYVKDCRESRKDGMFGPEQIDQTPRLTEGPIHSQFGAAPKAWRIDKNWHE